ncbi:MAG: Gfo/Idh/MocA family oxidoreductase [Proteobacteria bacterium]|nr:Gfo/Idh/MocA family oxidoreductase [Pseudomonadota bacterium]
MSDHLKVGIAGYGVVGKRRREFIDKHPNLSVTALCDQNFDGEGTSSDGIKYFTDYRRLISEPLDVLFVAMSNDVAAEVTIAGLEAGCHVFCEKPPGRDLNDIARVCESACLNPDQKLKFGFNHRYHDSVRDALRMVKSGELGRVLNLRGVYGKSRFISYGAHSDWRTQRDVAGGGILLDQGIHMVDLMRLFGGEFNEIHSIVTNDYWNHDVEDNAYALMRSDTGVVAMLHSTATQWRHRFSLDITLERGALTLAGILSSTKSYGTETLTVAWAEDEDRGDPREQVTEYEHDPSWEDEIGVFARTILDNVPVADGSVDEAFKTMQLVYRIYCADPDWKKRWGLQDTATQSVQPKNRAQV